MKKTVLLCLVSWILLVAFQTPSRADVSVAGGDLDCGLWMRARQQNKANVFESYVLGFLDGISAGEDREFWRGNGQIISRDSVYLWIDNYCRSNPLSQVVPGVFKLFREPAKKQLLKP